MKHVTRLILCSLLLASGFLNAADITTRISVLLKTHETFYVNQKSLKKDPPCLADDGRLKLTAGKDLLSVMMDAWGTALFQARTPEQALTLMPAISQWAAAAKARTEKMEAGLAGLLTDLAAAEALSKQTLPGEFRLFMSEAAAGRREMLINGLALLQDLDLWLIQNCAWLQEYTALIQEHEARFKGCWNPLGLTQTFLGTSLMQRIPDIAQIQRSVEDLLFLTGKEQMLFEQFRDLPGALTAEARPLYKLLYSRLSPALCAALAGLLETPYERSFVSVQLDWYAGAPSGAAVCADGLAAALNAYEARNTTLDPAAITELINYRQGEIYCGYRPDTRFDKRLADVSPALTEGAIMADGTAVLGRVFTYYKQNCSYGGSKNISESFDTKKADCFRLSNMVGVLLANSGYAGIYPMRSYNHGYLGFMDNGRLVTCDPLLNIPPRNVFPDIYIETGMMPTEQYKQTIGGWAASRVLLMPECKVLEFSVPGYPATPAEPATE